MESLCASNSDDKERCFRISPNLGEGDRFISEDGEKEDLLKHARDQETDEHTKDVKDVIREERHDLEEVKKGKRNQKRSSMTRSVRGYAQFHREKEERLDNSGYVRHLTERELFMQEQEVVRKENLEKYGHIIDENIVRLTNDYVLALARGEKNNLKKFQPMECVILAMTKGPANLKELEDRLNFAIDEHVSKHDFRFGGNQLESILSRIRNATHESQWLRKFLQVIDSNGNSRKTRYQFPPQLMKLAAEDPHKLWIALSAKIAKTDEPFEEKDLLEIFPELSEISKMESALPSKKPEPLEDKDFRTRVHHCEAARRHRQKELVFAWRNYFDVSKWQLLLGLMQVNPCIASPKRWMEKIISFIKENHNSKAQFQTASPTDVTTILRQKLFNESAPIFKLLIIKEKTAISKDFGLIPDAAKISWEDICKLIYDKPESWKLLEDYCLKYPEIASYVKSRDLIPEKEEKPEDVEAEEQKESLNAQSSILEIVKNVVNGTTDEELGKLVRENFPKLLQMLDISVNIGISMKK